MNDPIDDKVRNGGVADAAPQTVTASDLATEAEPPFDYPAALLAYAAAEQRLALTELMCERFHELYIQPYEVAIEAQKQVLADLKARITAAARAAALEDGDFHPHPSLEIKRKPQTWKYDDTQMLAALKAKGEVAFIRVKEELNRIELNKAFGKPGYKWLPATPTPPEVTVSIRPLGDLFIPTDSRAESDPT
ncbi:MAG: hypothetical protein K8L97_01585 [Anaerolineae bacterium]|nr:hypothetical protein [Anaerolineae bacterium]